jgi:hypothetical protein
MVIGWSLEVGRKEKIKGGMRNEDIISYGLNETIFICLWISRG